MKVWRNLLICTVIFILFWVFFDSYLTCAIKNGYNLNVAGVFGEPIKDKGTILQQTSLENNDLLLFGSSELAFSEEQSPRVFFPNSGLPYNANTIGRAGVMSLEHTLNINALDYTNDKKVVYLLSFQWFMGDVLGSDSFYANFSKDKFYKYMTDFSIPNDEKIYMASRVSDLTRNVKNKDDLDAWAYSKLCKKCPFFFNAIQILSSPYLMFEQAVLSTKDKALALNYLGTMQPYQTKQLRDINWSDEYNKAEAAGKSNVHDSRFYFNDGYANYISSELASQKNADAEMDLQSSKEYADFEIFLKTCKRKEIKPLIVVQSGNGWYYDYLGLSEAKRKEVYDRLCTMAQRYGFTVYSMADLEYVPYAYYDAWHPGWKGWLYVNQKITEYFNNNF